MTSLEFDKKRNEMLRKAEEYGLEQNFMFLSTFDRYQRQIKILRELEKVIEEEGTLVEKEYVKGRGNIYVHPAIKEYNSASTAANLTASTLIKILKEFRSDPVSDDEFEEF